MPRAQHAAAACVLVFVSSCAPHHSAASNETVRFFAGMPVYPSAAESGSVDGRLAVFSSQDAFGSVADWYRTHMPHGARSARDNTTSQATWAIFSARETKTVHVEVVDGTVRITLADVALSRPSPTAR